MARGFSDCCHYEDGYDDGYEDGQLESGVKAEHIADVFRVYAQDKRMAGDHIAAALLEEIAEQVTRDTLLERRLEDDKKRVARIRAMYEEARAVA